MKTGKDSVKTGIDSVKTGKDSVKTGIDSVKTGKDSVKTGINSVKTGKDSVKTGTDSVKTGIDSVKTGTEVSSSVRRIKTLPKSEAVKHLEQYFPEKFKTKSLHCFYTCSGVCSDISAGELTSAQQFTDSNVTTDRKAVKRNRF